MPKTNRHSILGYLIGAGIGIISFLVAAMLSLITIAVAWIFYRPLLAVGLIVVAIALVMAIKGRFKTKQAS